jgi:hypothetical protein
MKTVIWFSVLCALFLIAVYVEKCISKDEAPVPANAYEHFGAGLEERIISVYQEVLQRSPNSKELIHDTRRILNGSMTFDGLKQRLIDSDEYMRIIKVQSNSLSPELNKIISDRAVLKRLAEVYLVENKRNTPKFMILPLKDVYIRLDYNENAMRAMYRDAKYPYFEEDVKFTRNLDYKQLMTVFETYFNKDDLIEKGTLLPPLPASPQSEPLGVGVQSQVYRTINDMDGDSTALINNIMTPSIA